MAISTRARNWILGVSAGAALGSVALVAMASRFSSRYEPYLKEQVVAYLEKQFQSSVELESLRVSLPGLSPVRIFLREGRGVLAQVEGRGLTLRHKGRRDLPPMFAMDSFHFGIDLGTLLGSPRTVPLVAIQGMRIHIPPKGDRPEVDWKGRTRKSDAVIGRVQIDNGLLVILPKTAGRKPLEFAIHDLQLDGAGLGRAMKYKANLTNPKPPGQIASEGSFGPWGPRGR